MRLIRGLTTRVEARAISCERMYDSLRGLDLEMFVPGESRYLITYDYALQEGLYRGELVSPLPYAIDEAFMVEIDSSNPQVSWLPKEQRSPVVVALKWLMTALVLGLTIYLAHHFDLPE